eukprot:TRINITY_DN7684_c0_g1_i1.p1 TRINITY_DN7684_c0_g1~~TRINITY_DN7684_c0_g1_i1.p1  ORF type:complete len:355 (-),score=99.46 TRINITY_DN7684_c0_g1_i1:114-1178(-)
MELTPSRKAIDSPENISIESFHLIKVIGKGTYGKVVLVKKKDDNKIYALKMVKKEVVEKRKQTPYIQTERNVLVGCDHPFIIKLAFAFQNERKLFFALEYCPGGELFYLLQRRKTFTEDQAKFYAAQIVLAIEHLHERNVIYRDLKPENVILDAQGYIRITDFGLAKMNISDATGAFSICGTPEYLAPEVLKKQGHGKPVDWWTLGCLIFEMLTGWPPFYTKEREELFRRIKYDELIFPKHLSASCRSLLEGLFQKNSERRLGSGRGGAKEIMSHAWFSDINFSAILKKEVRAPFTPKLKDELDISNFDREFTEAPVDSAKDNSVTQRLFQHYDNFSFDGAETPLKQNEEPAAC